MCTDAAITPDLLLNCEGKTVFQEEAPQVYPVNDFPERQIVDASRRLIEKHANQFRDEKIHSQVVL